MDEELKDLLQRIYSGEESEWDKLEEKLCAGEYSMVMIHNVLGECVSEPQQFWWKLLGKYQETLYKLMNQGEILIAEQLLTSIPEGWHGKSDSILLALVKVFRQEVEHEVSPTVFDVSEDISEVINHYVRVKYYMRRLEFGLPAEYQQEVYDYCIQTGVSDYFIFLLLRDNIYNKEAFCTNLAQMFAEREGVNSMRAKLYEELSNEEAKE